MVSICVPTYRYDPYPLIEELRRQIAPLGVPSELLVFDDASPEGSASPNWLTAFPDQPELRFRCLPRNLGRGAIRNLLVREACYPYVLLLDVDAGVPHDYLATYLHHLNARISENFLISGGRRYSHDPPADPTLHLHWWYGCQRESTGQAYQNDPFLGFQSNNFLAPRELLLAAPFSEDALGYGHEDTLWGQQLRQRGVDVLRIDNQVTHLGLETAQVFLRKQREAVGNLVRLRNRHPSLRTRLTDFADRAAFARHLLWLVPEPALVHYLTGKEQPNLRALDVLKLRWYFAERAE